MTNFKNGLGTNIKNFRKVRNITQEDLAGVIGIHSRQLSKIETGEHFPSCKTTLFHELSLMQPEMCWIFIMVMY